MSRGLGVLQHRVCEALEEAEGNELPLRELRRRLGDPDRSNLRRIRGLLEREIVEEPASRGEPSVALSDWGYVSADARPDDHPAWGNKVRFERGKSAGGTRWFVCGHRFVHGRSLGLRQRRILAVLRERSDPLDEGLPVAVVAAMVGGGRANTGRAVRRLLLCTLLEESEDGGRIRLSSLAVESLFVLLGPTPGEFVDGRPANGIGRGRRDAGSTRPAPGRASPP